MLNREEIMDFIGKRKLISGYIDLNQQLTPNGFDLTAAKIFKFDSQGALDFSNKQRKIPQCEELIPVKDTAEDKFGWWDLKPGAYKILTNEAVNLDNDLIALAFPRSSLLRMGAFTQNGVWDAGFKGKGEFILIISNPLGVRIKQNARLIQLIFTHINETSQGYKGIYNNK